MRQKAASAASTLPPANAAKGGKDFFPRHSQNFPNLLKISHSRHPPTPKASEDKSITIARSPRRSATEAGVCGEPTTIKTEYLSC